MHKHDWTRVGWNRDDDEIEWCECGSLKIGKDTIEPKIGVKEIINAHQRLKDTEKIFACPECHKYFEGQPPCCPHCSVTLRWMETSPMVESPPQTPISHAPIDSIGVRRPEVGLGATLIMHSDRHAYTITRISPSGKTFWMRQDAVTARGAPRTRNTNILPTPMRPRRWSG